jgi:membrane-associated phospholipid phosphatase
MRFTDIQDFVRKYKHGIPALIYTIFYLTWFNYLEAKVLHPEYVIHTPLDDKIPFVSVFVIPYLLWFIYVLGFILYFLFSGQRRDYERLVMFLIIGMTLFLIISTLWPNGHHLRPTYVNENSFLGGLVAMIYRSDSPNNLWPSIHVYNSLGVHIAVMHSRRLRDVKWVHVGSFILCTSIVASTMLIKQHSVFDVVTAFLFAAVLYYLIYNMDIISMWDDGRTSGQNKTRPQIG